ncbi:MAG: aspartate aminotransferase family protein [Spirochaetia bacterium]|nr:aspartate aminotransferase family protein [Spirochaetia bacterium]
MKEKQKDYLAGLYKFKAGEEDSLKNKDTEISYDPERPMSFEEIKRLDEKYLLQTYARMPVSFLYGAGEFLYDTEGKEYIDFLSGIAVNSLGHAHSDLIAALNRQADMLWHTSNLFFNAQQALLARALVEISFNSKVFFCNSGTEANECALKTARAFGQKYNKQKILALKHGFHGRTFGSMSLTGQSKVRDGFGALLENIDFVEPNNITDLQNKFDSDVCGLFLEPILGEGGVLPLTDEFLSEAKKLCEEKEALLVFDEIQTGIGRTGKYFAYQHSNVTPDILTIAKGLGGGVPIGAVLIADKYCSLLESGSHGSTFGGGHLATAVAYEVLRSIESAKILENVQGMSDYLFSHLENIKSGYPDTVKEIRGKGLLIGIVLREDIGARPLVAKALEKGLVLGRAGENVLRLAPPLILRMPTAERALEKIEDLIKEI